MPVRTGEILFVKCVKGGIPNRDPLRDSDARRLFGEDDGRISLSDVSIKRDVRDYVLARFDYKFAADPGQVYHNQKVQSALYGLLIQEVFGVPVRKGFLCYTRSH